MARRCMLLACLLVGLHTAVCSAQPRANSDVKSRVAATLAPHASNADALLAIDRHRSTVIDRIVTQWGDQLATSSAALKPDQLRAMLSSLRADQLLAASLAGTLDGLRDVLAQASYGLAKPGLVAAKALGDASDDLVYTPINPCRIVDTRLGAGGFLANDTERDWKVSRPGGSFTDQGGASSDCGIPASPAAVLANFAVTGSSQSGVLFAWAFSQPSPVASTLNYAGGETIANAIVVPLAQGQPQDLSVFVSASTHVVVDVMGYFKSPNGAGPYFAQGGNAFGTFAALGTLDNNPLDIFVNNALSWRVSPDASGISPIIVGGYGGAAGNTFTSGASGAVIGGGGANGFTLFSNDCGRPCRNRVAAAFGTVGGGAANIAGDDTAGVTETPFTTVGGGFQNTASGFSATVAGGYKNTASASSSTVAGGNRNTASVLGATVTGGYQNTASASYATVAGGISNTAGGNSATAAGNGNVASGDYSTIPGGIANQASGEISLAAGDGAQALYAGEFVWADAAGIPFNPGAISSGWSNPTNTFNVRATGGVWFVTSTSTTNPPGCSIGPGGGAWGCTSSRDAKTDFEDTDVRAVLDKVLDLPIQTWRFKTEQDNIRHLGPMAQDFHAAFELGDSDKTIGMQDADGVALAAIQGLNQLVQEKGARIAELKSEVSEMRGELAALRAIVAEFASTISKIADR